MLEVNKSYMKSGEAARMIGVSVQTLRNWQHKNILIPEQTYPSGHRKYSVEQIEKFIEEQEIE